MCILHAGLLEDCMDCYDFQNYIFKIENLQKRLDQLSKIYSKDFLLILSEVLQINENLRPDPQQLYKKLFDEKANFMGNQLQSRPQTQGNKQRKSFQVQDQNQDQEQEQNQQIQNQNYFLNQGGQNSTNNLNINVNVHNDSQQSLQLSNLNSSKKRSFVIKKQSFTLPRKSEFQTQSHQKLDTYQKYLGSQTTKNFQSKQRGSINFISPINTPKQKFAQKQMTKTTSMSQLNSVIKLEEVKQQETFHEDSYMNELVNDMNKGSQQQQSQQSNQQIQSQQQLVYEQNLSQYQDYYNNYNTNNNSSKNQYNSNKNNNNSIQSKVLPQTDFNRIKNYQKLKSGYEAKLNKKPNPYLDQNVAKRRELRKKKINYLGRYSSQPPQIIHTEQTLETEEQELDEFEKFQQFQQQMQQNDNKDQQNQNQNQNSQQNSKFNSNNNSQQDIKIKELQFNDQSKDYDGQQQQNNNRNINNNNNQGDDGGNQDNDNQQDNKFNQQMTTQRQKQFLRQERNIQLLEIQKKMQKELEDEEKEEKQDKYKKYQIRYEKIYHGKNKKTQLQKIAIQVQKDFMKQMEEAKNIFEQTKVGNKKFEDTVNNILKSFRELIQISNFHDQHFHMLENIFQRQKQYNTNQKWEALIKKQNEISAFALFEIYNSIKQQNQEKIMNQQSYFAEFQKQYEKQFIKKIIKIAKEEDLEQLRVIKSLFHGGYAEDYADDDIEDLFEVVAGTFLENKYEQEDLQKNATFVSIYDTLRLQKRDEKIEKGIQTNTIIKQQQPNSLNNSQNDILDIFTQKEQLNQQHQQSLQQSQGGKKTSFGYNTFQSLNNVMSPPQTAGGNYFASNNFFSTSDLRAQSSQSFQRLVPLKKKTTNFFNDYEAKSEFQKLDGIIKQSNDFVQQYRDQKIFKTKLNQTHMSGSTTNLQSQNQLKTGSGNNLSLNIQQQMNQNTMNSPLFRKNHLAIENQAENFEIDNDISTPTGKRLAEVIQGDDFKEMEDQKKQYLKEQGYFQTDKFKSNPQLNPFKQEMKEHKYKHYDYRFKSEDNNSKKLDRCKMLMEKNDTFLVKLKDKVYNEFRITKNDIVHSQQEQRQRKKNKEKLKSMQQKQMQENQQEIKLKKAQNFLKQKKK